MKRREFITLAGTAAAWPLAARAQQRVPVAGFLIGATRDGYARTVQAVHRGLEDTGFAEGRNLGVEYRYADEQYDRLPMLAADLVGRRVAAIFATGSVISAMVAKAATTTIPVVFAHGSDPVKYGLVPSLARPGGNITGVTFFNSELGPKRLELMHDMLPQAAVFAFLVNPVNPNSAADSDEMKRAASALGVSLVIADAAREQDLDGAFANLRAQHVDALILNNDTLFQSRTPEIIELAARHALPTMYTGTRYGAPGGLVGYGANTDDMYRVAGTYLGRVLKGERPADLPVMRPTKFGLAINLKTAKALGLTISESFLLRADEVIE